MKVIFQSSAPFRFSFSLAGCEVWIGRRIQVSVTLPRAREPGIWSESAELGRSFLGRGYPSCFGGVAVGSSPSSTHHPSPFQVQQLRWGVGCTTDLSGYCYHSGEEKIILALGLRSQSMSLRKHDGRCLPSGRRVCLGPFSSSWLEKLGRGDRTGSKAGLRDSNAHPHLLLPSKSSQPKQSHQLGTEYSNTWTCGSSC